MDKLSVEILTEEMIEDVFQIEKTFFDVTEKSSMISSLTSDTLKYFVLKLGTEIVGFLECSIVVDEAELYEIAIKEKFQGLGYSKILMDYFFNFCEERGVRTIFLEVNKINSRAIALYSKLGFKEYFVREKYYGDNDAILMRRDR